MRAEFFHNFQAVTHKLERGLRAGYHRGFPFITKGAVFAIQSGRVDGRDFEERKDGRGRTLEEKVQEKDRNLRAEPSFISIDRNSPTSSASSSASHSTLFLYSTSSFSSYSFTSLIYIFLFKPVLL